MGNGGKRASGKDADFHLTPFTEANGGGERGKESAECDVR